MGHVRPLLHERIGLVQTEGQMTRCGDYGRNGHKFKPGNKRANCISMHLGVFSFSESNQTLRDILELREIEREKEFIYKVHLRVN